MKKTVGAALAATPGVAKHQLGSYGVYIHGLTIAATFKLN